MAFLSVTDSRGFFQVKFGVNSTLTTNRITAMSMYNRFRKFDHYRRNILAGLAGGALTGVSALATRQAALLPVAQNPWVSLPMQPSI